MSPLLLFDTALSKDFALFEQVATLSGSILYVYDFAASRNLYVSRMVFGILGYDPAEIEALGPNVVATLMHPDDRQALRHHHQRLAQLTHGQTFEYEFRMRRKDGAWSWLHSRETVYEYDAAGSPLRILGYAQDINARKKAEAAFNQIERQFARLVETMNEGVIIFDTDGHHSYINPRMGEIMGFAVEELLQTPPQSIFSPEFLQHFKQDRPEPCTGRSAVYELSLPHKDGHPIPVLVSITPIFEADALLGHFSVISDITELKRAEHKAHERTLELSLERERTHILTEFIQHFSHEFRTPLTMIEYSLYNLSAADDAERREHEIEKIRHQAQDILALVEALVTMANLDRRVDFARQPFDVRWMMAEIIEKYRQRIHTAGLELLQDYSDEVEMVAGDAMWLGKALGELFNNAIRYTPSGGRIHVAVQRLDGLVEIHIGDTGIGIDPAHHERVFERFFRVDTARTTRGLGMGLPIAQKIIHQHGGQIELRSHLGEGALFVVSLPTVEASQ